jgi:hypothetical protein
VNSRRVRLAETWNGIAGPLARLRRSLREDGLSVLKAENGKSSHELLATDAFLQRFQQVTDLALRKLLPRLLAVLEDSDVRHPFGAVFDRLDGFEVLADVPWWLALNELRNRLVHEYAMGEDERARELAHAWAAAERLSAELVCIREDRVLAQRVLPHD